jgi:exodeoxyribonuclease V alpha subunit
MAETLNGLIERVTYHNPENGFAVLKVVVKARQDLVTIVGNTTSVTAGEHRGATGRWVVDREHGQQFKADELKVTYPASAHGIEKYLASGVIRGIGPKLPGQNRGTEAWQVNHCYIEAVRPAVALPNVGVRRCPGLCESFRQQNASTTKHEPQEPPIG